MGDAEAPDISPAVIAALGNKTIAGAFASADGVVRFQGVVPGAYILAVVARPKQNEMSDEALLQSVLAGRYAYAQIQVPESGTVRVDWRCRSRDSALQGARRQFTSFFWSLARL